MSSLLYNQKMAIMRQYYYTPFFSFFSFSSAVTGSGEITLWIGMEWNFRFIR